MELAMLINIAMPFATAAFAALAASYVGTKVMRAEFDLYREVSENRFKELQSEIKSVHRRIDIHFTREEKRT